MHGCTENEALERFWEAVQRHEEIVRSARSPSRPARSRAHSGRRALRGSSADTNRLQIQRRCYSLGWKHLLKQGTGGGRQPPRANARRVVDRVSDRSERRHNGHLTHAAHAVRVTGVRNLHEDRVQHPYPAPLEDCYAGLTWVHQHASELDIDTGHLGIGGASSGAGLAAGLALLTRDRGRIPLAFQLLIYPMIDDRQVTSSSQWEVPVWPPSANALGWSAYLGEAYGGDVPMYAAAARATDLTNLPPALVVVGGVDGFVDEDVDFARRLNAAGIPTELHMYPGAVHGFDGMAATAAVAQRARRDIDDWLARQLGREPSKRD